MLTTSESAARLIEPFVIWANVVLGILLAAIVLYTVLKRRGNTKYAARLAELRAEFDKLIDKARWGNFDPETTRKVLTRETFPFFGRYLRDRISDEHTKDVSIEQRLSKLSGYDEFLRGRIRQTVGWERAVRIRTLSYLRFSEDVPFLRKVLAHDRSHPCVVAAALGLALCRDVESIPDIVRRVFRPRLINRDQLLAVLGAFEKEGAVQVTRVLEAEELAPAAVAALADYVAYCEYEPAAGILKKLLLETKDTELRVHLIEGLETCGENDACTVLPGLLQDPDFRVRLKTINAMERVGGDRFLDDAVRLVSDKDYWVRRNAAEALSRMGAKGMQQLRELTGSDDPHVKEAASLVVAELEFNRMRWRHRHAGTIA